MNQKEYHNRYFSYRGEPLPDLKLGSGRLIDTTGMSAHEYHKLTHPEFKFPTAEVALLLSIAALLISVLL